MTLSKHCCSGFPCCSEFCFIVIAKIKQAPPVFSPRPGNMGSPSLLRSPCAVYRCISWRCRETSFLSPSRNRDLMPAKSLAPRPVQLQQGGRQKPSARAARGLHPRSLSREALRVSKVGSIFVEHYFVAQGGTFHERRGTQGKGTEAIGCD